MIIKEKNPSQNQDQTSDNIRPELVVMPDTSTPASRTASKRLVRKHRVLNCIRQVGPLSRAEISKTIGFNLPTVSSLVDELVSNDLVIESEARESPMGRRPIPVSLNSEAASVFGIDIGKRTTVAIIVNLTGEIKYQIKKNTPKLKASKDYIAWVSKIVEELRKFMITEKLPPLAGIGVAIPGLVPSNIGNASLEVSTMISIEIQRQVGVSVFVENDARAMALGELWFGAGQGSRCFLNLNVGEGLGMGVIMDGNLMRGAHGFAGELGQIPFGDPNIKWATGVDQCLENIASGSGIKRMAKIEGMKVTEAHEVAELARQGDAKAKKVMKKFSQFLTLGISCAINLYNPERVILSGRVMKSADIFLDEVIKGLPTHTLKPTLDRTEIIISDMIDTSAPLGSSALVLNHIFSCSHISLEDLL